MGPFLRWVGGKAKLVSNLLQYIPPLKPESTYFEPFLGAGSLFFALGPTSAVLGDKNPELINCFLKVRSRPDLVWRELRNLIQVGGRRAYYNARNSFNKAPESHRKAALFIYLNKSCFNGIWRVNMLGRFNVPYGRKKRAGFPTLAKLRAAAEVLDKADIRCGDFQATMSAAKAGDFLYLDPPYPPINDTAFFTHYTSDRFSAAEQSRVAQAFRDLHERGCAVLLSNANVPQIRKLYSGFRIERIGTHRWVASNGARHRTEDLVIMNY
jgi:DNA adenine methylase